MSITTKDGRVFAFKDGAYSLVVNEALDLNRNFAHTASIYDLDLGRGYPISITSPYVEDPYTAASNSLVHPSIIRHSIGVDGSPYLMAVTPFAGADDTTENPCIYVSDDLLTWRVPEGVTNPIVAQPAAGYNSDTHIYEHTDGYTYQLYRQYESGGDATVYASRSIDGITWTAGYPILTDLAATQDWASPSLYHDGASWIIVAIDIANSNAVRKLTKTGALFTSWMAVTPSTITPTHPDSLSWWHLDIRRLSIGRLIGLAFDGGAGGGVSTGPGGGGSVWLWQSDDAGVTWGVRQITRSKSYYRSSLIIDGESISVALVWVESTTDGTAVSTAIYLHRLTPGRIDRRRLQANLQSVVTYSIAIDEDQNVLAYTEGFAGGAADLTSPWSQVTVSPMRRNGSSLGASTNTSAAGAVIDVTKADHWARVQFVAYASGSQRLIVKYIDADNYVSIGIEGATGKLSVKGFVATVATLDEAFLLTPTLAAGIVVRAVVDGLILRVFVNGVEVGQYDIPADLATGTSVGIYSSGSASNTFDVFACGIL
jgi:hypothetical protein